MLGEFGSSIGPGLVFANYGLSSRRQWNVQFVANFIYTHGCRGSIRKLMNQLAPYWQANGARLMEFDWLSVRSYQLMRF